MNRQIAIQIKNGKRVFRSRNWRTWEPAHNLKRAGRFSRWGKIKEFNAPDKILCDFDTPDVPRPAIFSLCRTIGVCVEFVRFDRTRRGWHCVIKLRQKLTNAERIAASAILGSDPARARLDLCRAISIRLYPSKFWEKRISVLFERKVRAK